METPQVLSSFSSPTAPSSFCVVAVTVTVSLPRLSFMPTCVPTGRSAIIFRAAATSSGKRTLVDLPFSSSRMSCVFTPALAAGEPRSTLLISTPLLMSIA